MFDSVLFFLFVCLPVPISLSYSPTGVSCNYISNKLLALEYLSQDILLGELKLRYHL